MDYRQLGRCGLRVSTLTLGTMTFGGSGTFASVGDVDLDGARRQIDLCLDAGVNLIDTADVYSAGAVGGDRRPGAASAAATACCWPPRRACRWGRGPTTPGSRATTSSRPARRACGACAPTTSTSTRCTSGTARRRWRRRSTRSTRSCARARCATSAARTTPAGSSSRRWGSPIACTCSASSASRSTTRCRRARPSTSWCRPRSTRAWASSSGARWPAACCRASTAATPQPEQGRHLTDWDEPPVRDQEQLYDIVDVAGRDRRGPRRLGRPGRARLHARQARASTSLVIGARTEEQLADNLAAADLELGADERARLDEVSAPPLLYPYWHQAKTAADRLSAADLTLLAPHVG